jgi:hypothetical protein
MMLDFDHVLVWKSVLVKENIISVEKHNIRRQKCTFEGESLTDNINISATVGSMRTKSSHSDLQKNCPTPPAGCSYWDLSEVCIITKLSQSQKLFDSFFSSNIYGNLFLLF